MPGYDPSFGHAMGFSTPYVVHCATRTYSGKTSEGTAVKFKLPYVLENGCRVSLNCGGLVGLLLNLGELELGGKYIRIGSCDVLKG
jgi:hypothetical protein